MTMTHDDTAAPLPMGDVDHPVPAWDASEPCGGDGGRIGRLVRRRLEQVLDTVTAGDLDVQWPDGTVTSHGVPGHPRRARLHIDDGAFFGRIARHGRLAPGDGWVAGEWTADDPAVALEILARTLESLPRGRAMRLLGWWQRHRPATARRNTPRRARRNIAAHYDLGNDLFSAFLDETMTYSCAIFEHPDQSLADAQSAKYDRICARLQLQPGDRVLEVGCGWGGFAIHAASRFGVHVTGVTISTEQHRLARERVTAAGLDDLIDIRLVDYRTLTGTWDKVASIEMFEAIGYAEFDTWFETVDRLLAPDGIVCLQTIAISDQRFETYRRSTDWIQRTIFPGGLLPSVEAMSRAMSSASSLNIHALDEIGPHYAPTLRAWQKAFIDAWPALVERGYDDRFRRTWQYYLAFCEAGFAARLLRNVQVTLTRPGNDQVRAPGLS